MELEPTSLLIFTEPQFFLGTNSTTVTSINDFCLVFLTLEFFVRSIFLTTDTIRFRCSYIAYFKAFSGVLISSFISLYSLNTLFTEKNLS